MQALRAAHGHTILCGTAGCAALVDLQSARTAAHAADRTALAPGDGCAGSSCSRWHAPGRFRSTQERKAAALLSGGRTLVLVPPHVGTRVPLWAWPPALAEAKARAVLADTPAPSTRMHSRMHSRALPARDTSAVAVAPTHAAVPPTAARDLTGT